MARKPTAGPASDPELLILSSLADGPKHGWAIMSDIEAFAGVTVGPGTLYNAITRAKRWCNVIVQSQNILAAAPFA